MKTNLTRKLNLIPALRNSLLRILLFVSLPFAILIIFLIKLSKPSYLTKTVIIENSKFLVQIADNTPKRTLGLSGRNRIGNDEGMLFVFPNKSKYAFWMKEMKFPLDFLWIDDNKIVDLTENVVPPDGIASLRIYTPRLPVNKVLEINAGLVSKYRIQIGQTILIK